VNTDGIFTIDLSTNYSQKEIYLQSIADIEYVALETTDDVLITDRCLIRNPSVHSSGHLTVLTSLMATDHFFVLRKTVMDETKTNSQEAFVHDTLIYDLKTRAVNNVSFVNNDFPSGKWFPAVGVQIPQKNIAAGLTQLHTLFDAYHEKKLQGKLEKLVATLDEEDNPIVTIVKFK